MSKQILLSWLGIADLKAAGLLPNNAEEPIGDGPILGALKTLSFDELHLLHNQAPQKVAAYLDWLTQINTIKILSIPCSLRSPIDFGDIHQAVDGYLQKMISENPRLDISIHLSPGTPSMTAVSILLGKTKYNTRFVQSTKGNGGEFVTIPFDISAEFVPRIVKRADQKLSELALDHAPTSAAFSDIITQNPDFQRVIRKAEKIALRDVPALIMGESGTGKELFAKAIHNTSQRKGKPFITVNCGAIPKDLIDSALFGHIKGSFTGAVTNKIGYFEAANGGTLFLDEFGELPEDAQVRLLRVLQSGEISKVGDSKVQIVDVRLIAATNRDLAQDIADGRFREDLFYRVAIGVLTLPPLRERSGDLALLVDYLMTSINREASNQPGYLNKKISVKAKNIIIGYAWPGNVRELHGTLLRASIWAESDTITEFDIKEAMISRPANGKKSELPEIGAGLDIQGLLDDIKRQYITKALAQVAGNKKKATALLGLPHYQTLSNWMDKLGIEE
ncbi:sigma 54-interacting transcriptional regulator [Methylomonas sp. OY6]|uniref:Sigma 54-interacting transcriptional regulator n=1 Tax=Methylomonas defluvii TaxID=3045149 RepID=A0ABU4UBB0_9GAMM|nr:sigma 54-interacting transcriptional regulator [Methylomonas sp. OY6]MDX8126448.1 sigma 54-interacting transcriptional regulator [Methylomonas sp. OY6]